MKRCSLTLAILSATTVLVAEEDRSKKSDREMVQGTWKVVALEAGGKKASEDDFKKKRFLIEGDQLSLSGEPRGPAHIPIAPKCQA